MRSIARIYSVTIRILIVFAPILVLMSVHSTVLAAPRSKAHRKILTGKANHKHATSPRGDSTLASFNLRAARLVSLPSSQGDPIRQGHALPVVFDRINLERSADGVPRLTELPPFRSEFLNRVAGLTPDNNYVFFTIDPQMQRLAEDLAQDARAPNVAIVVMRPKDGQILALAEKSHELQHPALHAHFPAASLFKVVTTAAALERGVITGDSEIRFRGGNYTLNESNYLPDFRRDRRHMSVFEALGRSCNPVFARIALRYLDSRTVQRYANFFGFNNSLGFDVPLESSNAVIPEDEFGFSRAAAGFGDVEVSPIHAASLMAGLANGGILPRPRLIDKIISPTGKIIYASRPEAVQRIVKAETADELLRLMESTTTIGTSRKAFMRRNQPVLPGINVAGKTGTLPGDNPVGMNNWFIATAPVENPEIAIAVVVVNPGHVTTRASEIAREILSFYFGRRRARDI